MKCIECAGSGCEYCGDEGAYETCVGCDGPCIGEREAFWTLCAVCLAEAEQRSEEAHEMSHGWGA